MLDGSKGFEAIAVSYAASGGAAASLLDDGVAGLVVSHKKVLRANSVPAVRIEGTGTPFLSRSVRTASPFLTYAAMIAGVPS